jgi:hypothetical protein
VGRPGQRRVTGEEKPSQNCFLIERNIIMPEFKTNTPVIHPEPIVEVSVSANNPLPVGLNRFQLVVVDDAGNASTPFPVSVIVKDLERPTAVLEVSDKTGAPVDNVVPFGASFFLSGARSSDLAPGKIVEYQFTLLDRV